ncbi:MAG: PadR family transcriptional regulator [Acutalibacteraceae bacterium]|nr:PadR family transcriptional regulator [Bacillota bacterium]
MSAPKGIVTNMKKATMELLVLSLLRIRPMHAYEVLPLIHEKGGDICMIQQPYNIFNRLQESGYLAVTARRGDVDTRRRQYYSITDEGCRYYEQIRKEYEQFLSGAKAILDFSDEEHDHPSDR